MTANLQVNIVVLIVNTNKVIVTGCSLFIYRCVVRSSFSSLFRKSI